jgi:hypothetical protein
VKREPPEKAFITITSRPAIPKNMPITTTNEFEIVFARVMLINPYTKTVRPNRHKTTPTSTPRVSK